MARSFDVFDTLVARRWMVSDGIWNELEAIYKLPGFAQARRAADNGQRDIYAIYDELTAKYGLEPGMHNTLLSEEIKAEIQQAIPIRSNLDKVQHGDWLISDTYLPASIIMQILRSAGLTKQVSLYQSNGDKRNGRIWELLSKAPPEYHLGDNPVSDVQQPQLFGIRAERYPGTGLTAIESFLFNAGLKCLALLVREIRLGHPSEQLFDIAYNFNLPILICVAEIIHRRYPRRNLVFLGRDCFLLQKIYQAYYNGHCHYIPFSRVVVYKNPQLAADYLKSLSPPHPVYIDVSSTGATWEYLEKTHPNIEIMVLFYFDTYQYTKKKPVLPPGFRYIIPYSEVQETKTFKGFALEILNCADHGHICEIKQHGPHLYQAFFGEPEVPLEVSQSIHKPIEEAVRLAAVYQKNLREELARIDETKLIQIVTDFTKTVNKNNSFLWKVQGYLKKEDKYFFKNVLNLVPDQKS